jgi:hypothetical protein
VQISMFSINWMTTDWLLNKQKYRHLWIIPKW